MTEKPLFAAPGNFLFQGFDPLLEETAQHLYSGNAISYSSYITSTNRFPWQWVGALKVQKESIRTTICTGTLLSRHVVLTAAHCVYNLKTKQPVRQARFFLAYQPRGQSTYPSVRVRDVVFVQSPQAGFDNNFDLAFAILEKPPVSLALWQASRRIPIGLVDDRHFQLGNDLPLMLASAGYPIEGGRVSRLKLSATTTYRNAKHQSKDNQFEHKAFSQEGMSGGPIFGLDPVYNQFALVGVISSKRVWHKSSETWAVGVKINRFAQQRLLSLLQAYEPDYGGGGHP